MITANLILGRCRDNGLSGAEGMDSRFASDRQHFSKHRFASVRNLILPPLSAQLTDSHSNTLLFYTIDFWIVFDAALIQCLIFIVIV
jgi:hypothetical protein